LIHTVAGITLVYENSLFYRLNSQRSNYDLKASLLDLSSSWRLRCYTKAAQLGDFHYE
jgi:hypothetical protein